MKSILILSVTVILVHGRPEPPSGYNYPSPPSGRYGAPSGDQARGGFRASNGQSGFGGRSSVGQSSGSGFGFGSGSAGSFGGSVGGSNGFGGSFSAGQSSSSAGIGQNTAGQSERSSLSEGASSDDIIINKHVYVHVAPPELEEEAQQRAQVRVPPPQKNYKIIFIKAPTSSTANQAARQIPPIPQNEEKTLVYVLVKKPEEQADIEIPTPEPTEPSKPEVYFIRYQSRQESNGQQGGAVGGNDVSQDDTVEVGARQNGAGQGGFGASQGSIGTGQGSIGTGQGSIGVSQGSIGGSQENIGAGQVNAGPAAGRQGGASSGRNSYSSSRSSSAISRQYGAPNSSGPY